LATFFIVVILPQPTTVVYLPEGLVGSQQFNNNEELMESDKM
jgi:hypothetical protein